MALAPALDLRDETGDPRDEESIPFNVEWEQALLGALLFDPPVLDALPEAFGAQHFYEPFHGRLFSAIEGAVRRGLSASPTFIAEEFRPDKVFRELGGVRYLADLIDRAPPSMRAPEYAAGVMETYRRRALVVLGGEIVTRGKQGGPGHGADDVIADAEKTLFSLATGRGPRAEGITVGRATAATVAYVQRPPEDRKTGVRTGLEPVDLRYSPLRGLMIVAARPSVGKSTFGAAVALGVAAPELVATMQDFPLKGLPEPRTVLDVHLEMDVNEESGGEVASRHLSNIGYHLYGPAFPTYEAIERNRVSSRAQVDMMVEAQKYLAHVPIIHERRSGLTVPALRSIIRRKMMRLDAMGLPPLGAVIIDHVGLIRGEGKRYEAQTEIAQGLMDLKGEIGLPIIALVQLNRDVDKRENRRPQIHDLRDTGAWEECADCIAFLYRESYYAERDKEPAGGKEYEAWRAASTNRDMEVIFAKVRAGNLGTAKVWTAMAWNALRGEEPERKGVLL